MSSSRYKTNPLILLGVPTLEERPLSWEWMDYYMAMQFPLGCALSRQRVHGLIVDEARNDLCEQALKIDADYLLFLGDDVLPSPNLFGLLYRHREMLVTGVYCTKEYPTRPYLWNGLLRAPYEDWKVGEYFPVDWAGCDALLIHTDVLRAIERPWFSRDWKFEEDQRIPIFATEDLYFFTKAKQAGFQLYCDTQALCDHQDRTSRQRFGITSDMPQMLKDAPSDPGAVLVADLGSGYDTPWFGRKAQIKRYDWDPKTHPDVRCDIRAIPEPDGTFDIVHARHVLEHFMPSEAPAIVREWLRILRVGGELRISVPNLAWGARKILEGDADPDADVGVYPHWQVFGRQNGSPGEVHRNGFTRHGLRRLLESVGVADCTVEVNGGQGENLQAIAHKDASVSPPVLGPIWREMEAGEIQVGHNGESEAKASVMKQEQEPVNA